MCRNCRLYADYLESIGFDMSPHAVESIFHTDRKETIRTPDNSEANSYTTQTPYTTNEYQMHETSDVSQTYHSQATTDSEILQSYSFPITEENDYSHF